MSCQFRNELLGDNDLNYVINFNHQASLITNFAPHQKSNTFSGRE